jgi:large subunit ribosomal protein L15
MKAGRIMEQGEMKLHHLRPPKGTKTNPKRVGRGTGSGHGKTSCRGHKGQNARSGGGVRPGFEGGQMPLARRLPKRGFKNIFRVEYQVVNVSRLDVFESGAEVNPVGLLTRRMIRKKEMPVKILGKGEITLPLTVKVHAVSETARKKIEEAGGRIELIESGR